MAMNKQTERQTNRVNAAINCRLTSQNKGNEATTASTTPEDEAGQNDMKNKGLDRWPRLDDHSAWLLVVDWIARCRRRLLLRTVCRRFASHVGNSLN